MLHEAIRKIHTNVNVIDGDTSADILCYDDDENLVDIDWEAVEAEREILAASAIPKAEYLWAQSELAKYDIEWKLQYTESAHRSKELTYDVVNSYQEALRDYVSYNSETGLYVIMTDKPESIV